MINKIMILIVAQRLGNNLRNVILPSVFFPLLVLCLFIPVISSGNDCSYLEVHFDELTGLGQWTTTDGSFWKLNSFLDVIMPASAKYSQTSTISTIFFPEESFYIDAHLSNYIYNDSVYGFYFFDDLYGSPIIIDKKTYKAVGAYYSPYTFAGSYVNNIRGNYFGLMGVRSDGVYDSLLELQYQDNPYSVYSVGVAVRKDAIIPRVNGREVGFQIYGIFSYVPTITNELSLFAIAGVSDNNLRANGKFFTICSGPLSSLLEAPTLSYTLKNDQLTISWTSVSGATGYKLYLGTKSGSYNLGSYNMGNTTQFGPIDASNIAGTFYIAATAYDDRAQIESGYSNEISFTLGGLEAPTLSYTLKDDQLTLSWTSVSGATGYRLYLGTKSGSYAWNYDMGNYRQGTADVSTWTPDTYYSAVIAYNDNGQSAYSNEISFQTNSAPVIDSLSPNSGKPGDWVVISGHGFNDTQGSGTVTFAGTAATNISSWSDTTIVVAVPNITSTGDVVVTVDDEASNGVTFTIINACSTQQVAGKNTPETRVIDMGLSHGTFRLDYETYQVPDRIIVYYDGATLFDTGCVGTNGTKTKDIGYSGWSTQITVEVQPNCTGTSSTGWEFKVHCPYVNDY
ncbi:MAG: IPT/TIG domain-containing protein [Nitrospirae bacterium]|nr:IPT/TIG domain-containing protein [Nitrospirota bacterium]